MLDKEDFGKFYVSLQRGQRGIFINRISSELGRSYNIWRSHLMQWSRGIVEGKCLSLYERRYIEGIITEEHWKTMITCTV